MRVLIACEFSGTVRDAFIARGHDAVSCDLIPSERPGPHIIGNALATCRQGWDLMIAHPPCRYLANSGALRLYRDGKKRLGPDPERWRLMQIAADFFRDLLSTPVPRICVENPVMHGYATSIIGTRHSQIIQPNRFGADASKATCLWLKNLPLLEETESVAPRIVDGKPRWSNQTDSGQNRLGPSERRAADRARTYTGIAVAMADQWGIA